MATAKAKLVSQKELATAVSKAVTLAAARHKVAVEKDNLILNWELIGRLAKKNIALDAFTDDVAKQVNAAGIAVVPGHARFGRWIFVGIFEKARIPQLKGMGM
jgi:hypothetical protein